MANNIDRFMSRANERLMSCAQRSLDEINYIIDDMESMAEQCPEREDIRACVDEVKNKVKKATTESWVTANHWSEHFDGLGGGDVDTEEEGGGTEKKTDDSDAEK